MIVDEDDVDVVQIDKTSDTVDMTEDNVFSLTDRVESGNSCPMTVNRPGHINNLLRNLPRKRKTQPVDLVEGSPGRKKMNTPLQGRRRIKSEIGVNTHAKTNLITKHFKPFSPACGEGQAVQVAAGARDGGVGGGGGAVQNARAKLGIGLAGGELGGKTRRSVSVEVIGPDQTADVRLANPGQANIQLILARFQRGKDQN